MALSFHLNTSISIKPGVGDVISGGRAISLIAVMLGDSGNCLEVKCFLATLLCLKLNFQIRSLSLFCPADWINSF